MALGEQVTAEAMYVGKKGKIFEFAVVVRNASGEVGTGRHERAIVVVAKLEGSAEKRKAENQAKEEKVEIEGKADHNL